MSWTVRPSTKTGCVYERPLGHTELSFYYDGLLNGTSDTLRHVELRDRRPHLGLLDKQNVLRAWCSTKQYYPLLGAQIELNADGKTAHFVVSEEALQTYSQAEVYFMTMDSVHAVNEYVLDARQGPRRLNSKVLARLDVIRRTDVNRVHILLAVAHSITDGMSNIALMKRFLEELCASEPTPIPHLKERLAMALSEEELNPSLRLSPSRQRWLRAISEVIRRIRSDKLVGGHTLPQSQNPYDLKIPPKSSIVRLHLPQNISKSIIVTCRKHSLTFGHAYAVIAQVALTRVLCRRYIKGDIGEHEWAERRRQPMHTGGPLNLRPYLDKEWVKAGGNATVGCAIGFFWYTLPYMPLGTAFQLKVGGKLPSFDQLLSRDRFFLRSNLVKKQSNHVFKHPLFVDIAKEQSRERIERVMAVAQNFKDTSSASQPTRFRPPFVLSFAGSSMGNVEHLEQYEYPSRFVSQGIQPLLRVSAAETYLRCRPGELYLGSHTTRKELHMFVFFDESTYDVDVVDEWLKEVKDAAIWYLGHENSGANAKM